LVLLSIPLILYRLGSYSVVNGDEAIYHGIAEGMVWSGDWWRLDFRGEHRVYDTFMNAPIQYWLRAILISTFGSSYWTMRILSALFAVASVLMTYRLVWFLCDPRSAFLAGLIQLTTFHFVYIHCARTGEIEPALAFLFALGAYLFLRDVEEGRGFIGHHVCSILLLNLKAPIVIIPLAAELAYFAFLPGRRGAFWRWARAALWIFPLGLSWHVFQMAHLWSPAVFQRMADMASGSGQSHWAWMVNAKFYARTLLFTAFPYVLFYPLAVLAVHRSRRGSPERERWSFIGILLATLVAFFLIVHKHLAHYVVPAYPFLSAYLGVWLGQMERRKAGSMLLVALSTGLALLLWMTVDLSSFNPFADQAHRLSMPIGWRSIGGVGPGFGILLTAALCSGALWALRAVSGEIFPRALYLGLALVLIGVGAIRVLTPLAHLGHQTRMAKVREALDDARATGAQVSFPVAVRENGDWRARFYFAKDYRVVPTSLRTRRRHGIHYLLYERDD
jgi:4-amino-4-deoxy-L-arabinose transferase-like glycosyltransferase